MNELSDEHLSQRRRPAPNALCSWCVVGVGRWGKEDTEVDQPASPNWGGNREIGENVTAVMQREIDIGLRWDFQEGMEAAKHCDAALHRPGAGEVLVEGLGA